MLILSLFQCYRGSDEEYSDDDDMSWKVRRAAAKCLAAVIATRHEMLSDFYKVVSPALIVRFKGEIRTPYSYTIIKAHDSSVSRFDCGNLVGVALILTAIILLFIGGTTL